MTEQQHPITPPQELMEQWRDRWIEDAAEGNTQDLGIRPSFMVYIATQAARWGGDQELEACCEWLDNTCCDNWDETAAELRDARRPKPPSLAEQALAELDQIPTHDNEGRTVGGDVSIIRTALERLQELESNG